MTFPCKYYYLLMLPVLFLCCFFDTERESYLPDDEAKIVRSILRENGYSIGDNELVDPYLEFSSSFAHADLHDLYYLILPAKNKHAIVLSDKINALDSSTMFITIKTFRTSRINSFTEEIFVDSIIFKTDSIVKMTSVLDLSKNEIKTIPKTITQLRVGTIDLRSNKLNSLPDEIMQIVGQDTAQNVRILLDNNQIDTLTLSDTLKTWLARYAYGGANWWKSQEQYRWTSGQ